MQIARPSRRRLARATVLVAAMVLGTVLSASSPSVAAGSRTTDTLTAGQSIAEGDPGIVSRNGEFSLGVDSEFATLTDIVPIGGADDPDVLILSAWTSRSAGPSAHGRARLVLQRDGNLVFRSRAGRVDWTSRTAGTGAHDRLVAQNNGDLVLYTRAGHVAWSSRTTAEALGTGQRLASGHRLWVWGGWNVPLRTLVMRSSGDLEYYCDSRLAWHSNTHRPGAYLSMDRTGNLVVYGPKGRPLWSSHTAGQPGAFLMISNLSVFRTFPDPRWSAPLAASARCD